MTKEPVDSTKEQPAGKPCWYELDWILPYKDLLLVVGFILVVVGVAFVVHKGAAMVVAGTGIIWLALRMGESK